MSTVSAMKLVVREGATVVWSRGFVAALGLTKVSWLAGYEGSVISLVPSAWL